MNILSVNLGERARPESQQKGPFIGRVSRVIGGTLYRSPKFKGATRREVLFAHERWLASGGFEAMVAKRLMKPATPTGDFLDKWFQESSPGWAATTLQTNTSTLNTWLKEDKLRALPFPPSIDDMKAFYDRLEAPATTKHRVHKLLSSAFQVAVEERRIPFNPCKFKAAPKKPKGAAKAIAFTSQDECTLLQFVRADPAWNALLLFAFDSGCRQGEIFGLQVRHIDFERSEVRIETTVDTIGGKLVVKDAVKSEASRRTIPLSLSTLTALKRLVGQKRGRFEHVFADPDGGLWTRTRFYEAWKSLLATAGIGHYRFHSTRHTMATRLLRAGMYLTAVSRRLGHSKPSVTLDVYSHTLPSDQGPLAEAFETMLRTIAPEIAPAENPGLRIAS